MKVGITHSETTMEGLLGRRLSGAEEKNSPKRLYYAGSMKVPLRSPRVAIVGSREAAPEGLAEAKKLAEMLAKNQITIVSGLARGIDTMAHRTAIECGGRTVAILGTPLGRTYPKENHNLQREMMAGQMVVSQYPAGSGTHRGSFVLRNRTMALVADASIIVRSRDGGGALHLGREALRLGRPLFICGAAADDPALEWPAEMLKLGAVRLGRHADVLEHLPRSQASP